MPVMDPRSVSLYDRWKAAFGRWARLAEFLNAVARALNRAHSLSPFCSLRIGPDGGLEHDFCEAALLRAARRIHPWLIDETSAGRWHVHGGRVWQAPGSAATVSGQDLGTASGVVVLCSTYSSTSADSHTITAGTDYPFWVSLDQHTWRVATPLGEIAADGARQWKHSDLVAPLASARAAVRFGDIPAELGCQFANQDGVNQFDSTKDVAVRFDIEQDPEGASNVRLRGRIRDFSAVVGTHINYTSLYETLVRRHFDWTSIAETVVRSLGMTRGRVVVDVYDGTSAIKFGYMDGLVGGTRTDATVIEIGDCTA